MSTPNGVFNYTSQAPTGKAAVPATYAAPTIVKIQWPNPSGGIKPPHKIKSVLSSIFG